MPGDEVQHDPNAERAKELLTVLYSTTDAMVWAREWCKIAREIEDAQDGRQVIDEGWMVGWFANAFSTAEGLLRKQLAEQITGYPITIDVDRLGQDDPTVIAKP